MTVETKRGLELLAEQNKAKQLYDNGMLIKDIAKIMSKSEDWVRQARRENHALQREQKERSLIFKR